MTSPNWRFEASALRMMGLLWDAAADDALTAFTHLGSVGVDFGQRVALRLRECAREAVFTASQLDVIAEEEQAPPCERDDAPVLAVVPGGDAA